MLTNYERVYPEQLTEALAGIFYLRSPFTGTSKIKEIWIWCGFPLTVGSAIFNLRINGVAQFAGDQRLILSANPSETQSNNSASKTNLEIEVEHGNIISVDCDQISKAGLAAPLVILVRMDDLILVSSLPDQTGNDGNILSTDGTTASWTDPPALELPTFEAGKVLSNDGTTLEWTTFELELPAQTNNAGKVLSTDGTTPEWITPPSGSALAQGTGSNTTASLILNAVENVDAPVGKYAIISRIVADRECRVRMYNNSASRSADTARAIGTDPTGEHGCLLDVRLVTGNLDLELSPPVIVYNSEAARVSTIPTAIQNHGTTGTVTVTYTKLTLEA